MCGTEQGLNAYLDAQQQVPDQVKHSCDAEDDSTVERDTITRRQGLQPWIAFTMVQEQVHDEKHAHQGEAAIENRMPRREEAGIHFSVIMRPPIEVDTTKKQSE